MGLVSLVAFFLILTTDYIFCYENLALNQPTEQLNQYNVGDDLFNARNAVDGQKSDLSAWGGQCTISANKHKTAIWWVNLTTVKSVHNIRIYYRTDNSPWGQSNGYTERFLGFHVYISNTTSRIDGYLCFHDTQYTRATIPSVVNITCPVHGQYVVYYNVRPQYTTHAAEFSEFAFNELCEVEVYGCNETEVYGPDCSLPCPDINCRYCHIETGACQGCKPGYQGHRCELPCGPLSYGEICSKACGNCSEGRTCHHVNGSCTNGCDVGVYGDKCNTPCPIGWHGQNCSKICSNCDECDRFSGQCTSPCYPGWKGLLCKDVCSTQSYGVNCSMACGNCSKGVTCNHVNGSCADGCDVGVYGDKCQTPCPVGWHGQNCSQMCKNCDECDRFSGQCQSPCYPGWKGSFCKDECNGGRYGQDCEQRCGACFGYKQCHHINGSCLEGCDAGFEGDNCTTECSSGKFGIDCEQACNEKCGKPNECNGSTGECEGGCQPGWERPRCENKCRNNMYGPDCSLQCGYCRNAMCHHINGTCIDGCDEGYKGENCTTIEECDPGPNGLNCEKKSMESSPDIGIIIGGIAGFVLACLVVVVVIVVLKRRGVHKTKRKSGSEKGSAKKRILESDFSSIHSKPDSPFSRENTYMETNDEKREKQQKKSDDPDVEVDDDEKIHSENPYGDFYANEPMIREIPLNQLESVIAENRKNGDDGFQKEYAVKTRRRNYYMNDLNVLSISYINDALIIINARLSIL